MSEICHICEMPLDGPGKSICSAVHAPSESAAPAGSVVAEEYKHLEIEVTRTQSSLVFLKVPKDFNHKACSNLNKILAQACVKTCTDSDWDSNGWQDTVEWQSIKTVPKEEAEQYKMYEVPAPDGKGPP